MKTGGKASLHPCTFAAVFGAVLFIRATAQNFTVLYTFTGGLDGGNPQCELILSSNVLYGTTASGIPVSYGRLFSLNSDGTGFRTIYSFDPASGGVAPFGGLVISGNTLYGTASSGGSAQNGTVFSVNIDGTGFNLLHDFSGAPFATNTDGAQPLASLILSSNTLYGTAWSAGGGTNGTVFKLRTDGLDFTMLHDFSVGILWGANTNFDGANPHCPLLLINDTLYGTTEICGSYGMGTVFKLDIDGSEFTTLHHFTTAGFFPFVTNADGAFSSAGLVSSGNRLYGTAANGGTFGYGTVFSINTDGSGFTNLHGFASTDGAHPFAGLVLFGNTLYGTTCYGGSSDSGTVFAVGTNGTDFTTLHGFSGQSPPVGANSDGANPVSALTLSGSTLHGTASEGGSLGYGTVFSISLLPQLTISLSGRNAILTWPTNYAGFDYAGYVLQSAPTISVPATWTNVLSAAAIVNGQYTVTNTISGSQQYYRLSR
jgi:uncharacterized repeat protein (TIGR03803 family)